MGEPFIALASPIVGDLIKDIYSFIKKQYHLAKGVEEDIKKLESKFTAIQSVLEDAEEKPVKSEALKDWLAKLREVAYDAQDVFDSFSTQIYLSKKKQQAPGKYFRSPIPSHKYDAALEIKRLLERVEDIADEKEKLNLKGQQGDSVRPAEISRETTPLVDESGVVGRVADREEIIAVLRSGDSDNDCNFSAIAITGIGGIGKTTLTQLVFNDKNIEEHFDTFLRMWVSVRMDFDLKRILREMIEFHSKMTMDINSTLSLLESRLLAILEGRRFLLVLDDVGDVNSTDWASLQVLLKRGGKGSKVLVTSRHTDVSEALHIKVVHYPLSGLPDDECWFLFKKMAFKEGGSPNGAQREVLEEIGKKIVDRCNHLPLAVKAMGGLLWGNVDVQTWRNILHSWIWKVQESKILPALKLSYYHLPHHLKQCFAFCSLFPKGYSFCKKELIKLWMAETYIQSRGQERAEVTENQCFHDLLVRSFFQSSNVEREERYRMHDLIHDLALSISSPPSRQVRDKPSTSEKSTSEKTRHASLLCEDVEQPALEIIGESKKLRTLLFPSDYLKNFGHALDKMFRTMRFMRVLDLSSSTIQELPESVEELILLRYLNLSKTEIKKLPNSICNLYHLETLKLLGCLWLFELPKDLGNLINLRHLELDEMFWYKASTLPPRIGSLINLENFHAFQVGQRSGYGIAELKDMKYLTGALHISKLENVVNAGDANLKEKESLQKVVFEWSDRDSGDDAAEVRVLEGLEPHSKIEELQICRYRGSTFPAWMRDELFRNLVRISLKHCTKCKILSLGQLPQLNHLSIKGMRELEEWADVPSHSLEMLTVLKISDCPKLRQLPPFFPKLEVLKIKKCNSLRALPVGSRLKSLILVDNPVVEDFVTVNDQGQVVATDHLQSFDLWELKIISCPMMQALPDIFALYNMEISRCPLLTVPVAPWLHYMALDACPYGTLVRAILSTRALETLVISNISNLTSLMKWSKLPRLKALYIRDCKVLESLSEEEEEWSLQSLMSLKILSIRGCPKLVTLASQGLPTALECLIIGSCPKLNSLGSEDILKCLTSLEDLYIEDCPMLQSLPEEGLSSSLQHLHIQGCPLLTKRCQEEAGGGQDWPKIMHIPNLEIIEVRSAPHSARPSWYNHFICCQGIDISEPGELQWKSNSVGITPRDGDFDNVLQPASRRVKKKWVDKSGNNIFMIYARSLFVSGGDDGRYWTWNCFKETGEESIEVAKLRMVCWLDVRGNFKMSDLSPGIVYEIAYVVKLTSGAYGWESPIKLKLILPGGKISQRQVCLLEIPRGEWTELNVGHFKVEAGETRVVWFELLENEILNGKNGLIIKGVIIRPNIKHIPDPEIDSIKACSAPQRIDIRELWELQWQSNSVGITPRDRDFNNVLQPSCCVNKKWVDESGNNNFMIYARSLLITWGENERYWTWNCFKETGEENIEVAKLRMVCWLEVRGNFKMSDLSQGIVYEIAYVVKLTSGAYGWESPIILKLILPGGKISQRQVCLLEIPREEWTELNVGHFKVEAGETIVCFELLENEILNWKNGLIIKGVIIKPKI